VTRYTPLWLQAGSYIAGVDRYLIGAAFPNPDVVGCQVTVGTGMQVNVARGRVVCPISFSLPVTAVLCAFDATEVVTLAAAPASGTNRIDLIICQPRGADIDGGANNDFLITSVTGAAAATPAAPAVPQNAVALAQIYVAGGSASVVAGNITDLRTNAAWSAGRGQEGRAVQSAADVAITANTETTICTLGALTYRANRRYEVRASIAIQGSVSTLRLLSRIYNTTDGLRANVIDNGSGPCNTAPTRFESTYVFQPGAADRAVEFRITAQLAGGTGTLTVFGTDPQKALLTAVDVGPAPGAPPP
jgi:hypothetical protein